MMDDLRLPSYYTVTPASVRYDRRLSYFDMVLYGEIIALATVTGYARASNRYFAMLYEKDELTISRAISKLQKCGHLHIMIENGHERKIYLLTPPLPSTPLDKNVNPPLDENVKRSPTHNARTKASSKESFIKSQSIHTPLPPSVVAEKSFDNFIKKQVQVTPSDEIPEALRVFFDSWPKS